MLQTDIQNTCGWWLMAHTHRDGTLGNLTAMLMSSDSIYKDDAANIHGYTFDPGEVLAWVRNGELP